MRFSIYKVKGLKCTQHRISKLFLKKKQKLSYLALVILSPWLVQNSSSQVCFYLIPAYFTRAEKKAPNKPKSHQLSGCLVRKLENIVYKTEEQKKTKGKENRFNEEEPRRR